MSLLRKIKNEAAFEYIVARLHENNYSVTEASRYLGVSSVSIYSYLKEFGVTIESLRASKEQVFYKASPVLSSYREKQLATPYQFDSFEHFKDVLAGLALQNIIRSGRTTRAAELVLNETRESVSAIIASYRGSRDPLIAKSWRNTHEL